MGERIQEPIKSYQTFHCRSWLLLHGYGGEVHKLYKSTQGKYKNTWMAEGWEAQLSQNLQELLPRRIHFKKATILTEEMGRKNRKKFRPINRPQAAQEDPKAKGLAEPPSPKGRSNDVPATAVGDHYLHSVVGTPRVVLFQKNQLQMTWKKPTPIGCGLNNLGNTCFLNATIQCLTYTPPLANACLDRTHSSRCGQQGFCLSCITERHINEALGRSKGGSITPKGFVGNLRAICKHFRKGRQEDSHEFLRYVIDHMQRNSLGSAAGKKLSKIEAETSMIHAIFGGVLQSQVSCQKCPYESDTFDPFLDLSLDMKGCPSLEKILERFCRVEELDKDNQYRCERCKKLSRAHKQFTIFKAPSVAVLHLKRFDFMGRKVGKFLPFPETLTLNPFMSRRSEKDSEVFKYQLYGVLVHAGGSVSSGHYYCYVKSPAGVWYEMNDESVQQVSLKVVLQQQAYILFYSRVPSAASQPRQTQPKQSKIPNSSSTEQLTGLLSKRKRAQLEQSPGSVPALKKTKGIPEVSPVSAIPVNPQVESGRSWKQGEPTKSPIVPAAIPQPLPNKSWKQVEAVKKTLAPLNPPKSNPSGEEKVPKKTDIPIRRWDEKEGVRVKSKTESKEAVSYMKRQGDTSFLTSDSLMDAPIGRWDDGSLHSDPRRKTIQSIQKVVKSAKPVKRDQYDREYDLGKVKKVRKPKISLFEKDTSERVNRFDELRRAPRVS